MTIKIEFPAGDKLAARVFSDALAALAEGKRPQATAPAPDETATAPAPDETEQAAPPPAEAEQAAPPPADAPRDTKGVPFNADYCAQAQDPYYGKGKRMGQWKKKRGVDDADYDAWYADELAALAPADGIDDTVNTATAFGAPAPQDAPQDVGSFMGWVSEKQAAGVLTQDQINAAWGEAGVNMADLFNSTPEETAASIAKVYGILAAQV